MTNTTIKPKKTYTYFVAYNFQNGTGSSIVNRNNKIKNYKDLEEVRDYLEKQENKKIAILNFILFEE